MAQINAYAEEFVIISGNLKPLEEVLEELYNAAQEIGLIINQEKSI
jgi:hypothetical protein